MDIVLIAGLWLDAGSWRPVAERLADAGHRALPLSAAGTEDGGETDVPLGDIVGRVVDVIDGLDGPVVLVAHSAATAIAHAVVDRRPHRVARAIHVGGFPTPDGMVPVDGWPVEDQAMRLPPWEAFHPDDLRDLDDAARTRMAATAVRSPAAFARDRQHLADPRRLTVPTTIVCTDFSAQDVEGWIATGAPQVAEIPRLHHLEYVDLPTGHWPQITRPDDLARIIAERAWVPTIDDQGRMHPPPAASEPVMAFAFLDHHRETLRWKADGLDRADLARTTAASSLTLGGLLKHLAWVEDLWFATVLHDRRPSPPWDTADWDSVDDWEFASAADDEPAVLWDLWRTAVRRSKALVAPALGDGDLDRRARRAPEGEEPVSLRWIVHHMIEEYARHNGHADLLREAIDGATGE